MQLAVAPAKGASGRQQQWRGAVLEQLGLALCPGTGHPCPCDQLQAGEGAWLSRRGGKRGLLGNSGFFCACCNQLAAPQLCRSDRGEGQGQPSQRRKLAHGWPHGSCSLEGRKQPCNLEALCFCRPLRARGNAEYHQANHGTVQSQQRQRGAAAGGGRRNGGLWATEARAVAVLELLACTADHPTYIFLCCMHKMTTIIGTRQSRESVMDEAAGDSASRLQRSLCSAQCCRWQAGLQ